MQWEYFKLPLCKTSNCKYVSGIPAKEKFHLSETTLKMGGTGLVTKSQGLHVHPFKPCHPSSMGIDSRSP